MVQTFYFSNIDTPEGVDVCNHRMAEMFGEGYSVALVVPVDVDVRHDMTSMHHITKTVMVTFVKPGP